MTTSDDKRHEPLDELPMRPDEAKSSDAADDDASPPRGDMGLVQNLLRGVRKL